MEDIGQRDTSPLTAIAGAIDASNGHNMPLSGPKTMKSVTGAKTQKVETTLRETVARSQFKSCQHAPTYFVWCPQDRYWQYLNWQKNDFKTS